MDNKDKTVTEVEVNLTENWDAVHTYDLLIEEEDGGAPDTFRPAFVGREELLGPIVNAIGLPDRRGTFLVSGYRGAGKTTLVIEAALRARERLREEGRKLLPLVLNVSEVSASLESPADVHNKPLHIDAYRLLTALLRALNNQRIAIAKRIGKPKGDTLAARIVASYRRASAAEYRERLTESNEDTTSRTTESRWSQGIPDLFKLIAAVAGVAALTAEGVALIQSGVLTLHVIAAALAGTAVLSYTRSVMLARSEIQSQTAAIEVIHDNSLHQLETDLKDILADLRQGKHRPIVVLEELDKIVDQSGHQLDAVIRYFKNLFTQAPALFFFVTDKEYFDLIARKIETARRERSYAVEHTFFTHRVFVNRPQAGDCLEYLRQVIEPNSKHVVTAVMDADQARIRALPNMELFERFVRVLMFRAQGHLFDLKYEMRRYVHVDDKGRSYLRCDEHSLPPEEQSLASFQFLIEQKARAYAFGGGREYANEVQRGCLYAVFRDLGMSEPQRITDFHPVSGAEGDQLDRTETARIQECVAALLDDLERGGAIEYEAAKSESDTAHIVETFVWVAGAAEVFRPVARLEDYEESLVLELSRLAVAADDLVDFGGSVRTNALAFAEALRKDQQEIKESEFPLSREKAQSEQRSARDKLKQLCEEAYTAHRQRLEECFEFAFEPLGTSRDGSLWLRIDRQADPRSNKGAGAVLLAYGSGDRLREDMREFVNSCEDITRLSLIHLFHEPLIAAKGEPTTEEAWQTLFSELELDGRYLLEVIPLGGKDPSDANNDDCELNRSAEALVFGDIWANQIQRLQARGANKSGTLPAGPYRLFSHRGEVQEELDSLAAALSTWADPQRTAPEPLLAAGVAAHDIELALAQPHIEVAYWPLVADQPAWLSLPPYRVDDDSGTEAKQDTQSDELVSDQEVSTAIAAIGRRLLQSGRILLGVTKDWPQHRALPAGARAIISAEQIPPELQDFEFAALSSDVNVDGALRLAQMLASRHAELAETIYQGAWEHGNSKDALEALVLSRYQRDPQAANQLFRQLAKADDPLEVADVVDKLYELEPPYSEALDELFRAVATAIGGDPRVRYGLQLQTWDPVKAKTWYEELRSKSDWYALLRIAGKLADSDPTLAVELYGWILPYDNHAANRIGSLFKRLEPEQAQYWKKQMAESGKSKPEQLYQFAWGLGFGDKDMARSFYQQAAEAGHTKSMIKLAESLCEADRAQEAETWYERAAQDGNARAMVALGDLLRERRATKKAETWYRSAVEQDDTDAMIRLARLIQKREPQEAEDLLRRAADDKDVEAMELLAGMLRERDPAQAETLYRAAAENGDHGTLLALGDLVLLHDPEEAESLYKSVAEATSWSGEGRHAEAMLRLGDLFKLRGDIEQARSWYQEAAERGHTDAAPKLAALDEESGIDVSRREKEKDPSTTE